METKEGREGWCCVFTVDSGPGEGPATDGLEGSLPGGGLAQLNGSGAGDVDGEEVFGRGGCWGCAPWGVGWAGEGGGGGQGEGRQEGEGPHGSNIRLD